MKPVDVAYRLLPGIKWLHGYTAQDAIADLIAGITVGLTVLPQGLAYATLAGLEPQVSNYFFFIKNFLNSIYFSLIYWVSYNTGSLISSMVSTPHSLVVLFMPFWAAVDKLPSVQQPCWR